MKRLPILLASLVLLATVSFAQEQSKSDLAVKVEAPTDAIRGGESFSYTITASNIGTGVAKKAAVTNDDMRVGEIVSGSSSKGDCEIAGRNSAKVLRCELGDVGPGETVSILVTAKIYDFGDISEVDGGSGVFKFSAAVDEKTKAELAAANMPALELAQNSGETSDQAPEPPQPISSVYLGTEEAEEIEGNNHARVEVDLLPSRNIPPRIKIVSPKYDSTLTRRARTPFKLIIQAEAFDPDGTIEKVIVRHSSTWTAAVPVLEEGKYLFLYEGKKYTAEDLEDHWSKFPPPEPLASQTGKNLYTYVMTDPGYGANRFYVEAVDNGGRTSLAEVSFTVKGDATIEFVSPKPNQIIAPGSDLVVETVSRLNEGQPKEIVLAAWDFAKEPGQDPTPRLELVSKSGNVYRHRYVFKKVPSKDVYSGLRATLIEDSGAITETAIGFLVRKRPKITITSLSNGQVFVKPKEIRVIFDKQDTYSHDQFRVYIDGKFQTEVASGYIWRYPDPGVHTIEIVAEFDEIELTRSEPIKIIVK